MSKIIILISLLLLVWQIEKDSYAFKSYNDIYDYTSLSRLTDPGEDAELLKDLPDDINTICDIANVQLVHYRMLSQWKIPKNEWNISTANHDIKIILDTLMVKGPGNLSKERKLEDRVLGSCTKESIFLTSLLRSKGIPARIRVGYFTNLYRGSKAIEFWKNVKEYEWLDMESKYPDDFTLNAIEVNRSIEHWITEYWDEETGEWKLLDMRPEYLQAYGYDVNYHIKEKENFEYAWQVWKRINNEDFAPSAYAEGDLDAKSHVRFQLLMDFYSLLNHDGPGLFDSNGKYLDDNDERRFLKKAYDDLTIEEITELDNLAFLLSNNPTVDQLINFYFNNTTLKIASIETDEYSFIYSYLNNN